MLSNKRYDVNEFFGQVDISRIRPSLVIHQHLISCSAQIVMPRARTPAHTARRAILDEITTTTLIESTHLGGVPVHVLEYENTNITRIGNLPLVPLAAKGLNCYNKSPFRRLNAR